MDDDSSDHTTNNDRSMVIIVFFVVVFNVIVPGLWQSLSVPAVPFLDNNNYDRHHPPQSASNKPPLPGAVDHVQ